MVKVKVIKDLQCMTSHSFWKNLIEVSPPPPPLLLTFLRLACVPNEWVNGKRISWSLKSFTGGQLEFRLKTNFCSNCRKKILHASKLVKGAPKIFFSLILPRYSQNPWHDIVKNCFPCTSYNILNKNRKILRILNRS
jgi:hypothetical protein